MEGDVGTNQRRRAYRSPLRDAQKQFTKDRIVEAALLVFARTDYASVTVDEIVAAADVSRQTFYIHFKSKADVLLEQLPIDDKHLQKLDRSLETRSATDLRSYLAAAIEWYEQSSALLLAVEVAASSDEEIARALREDVARVYSAETLPAYFALWPPAQHAEAMVRVRLVHAQLWGYFVRRQMGVDPDRELLLDTLVDVWTSTLYPKPS